MVARTRILLAAMALLSVFWGGTSDGRAGGESGRGKITGCPGSPNCVSTLGIGERHWIAPIAFTVSPEEAFRCLEGVVRRMKRAAIVVAEDGYIHAEFRSLLGFVDDVEFQVDGENHTILMRSASRMGYWDMGVNRKRLEAVRAAFDSHCR